MLTMGTCVAVTTSTKIKGNLFSRTQTPTQKTDMDLTLPYYTQTGKTRFCFRDTLIK